MYRTTKEENEILTRTGRDTPMGEFLRRYWWPIGISAHLKTKPTFIRIFGEDLVLFRNGLGKAGVIGAYCAHRRANLCLGDIEREGVRCRYHGWRMDKYCRFPASLRIARSTETPFACRRIQWKSLAD